MNKGQHIKTMLFNKIQEIIADYSAKYPTVLVKIEGFTSVSESDYKLELTYSEDITETTHPDFFKSNGSGVCIITKIIKFDDGVLIENIDRTPMFKKHGWSDLELENFKIK